MVEGCVHQRKTGTICGGDQRKKGVNIIKERIKEKNKGKRLRLPNMSPFTALILCCRLCLVSYIDATMPAITETPPPPTTTPPPVYTMVPPMWNQVPSSLAEFPTVNGTTYLNPWLYTERLGMYKIMVEMTAAAMADFGPLNTGNVLWGLPAQHGWQYRTGRLRDFSNSSHCGFQTKHNCISPRSWWASMNYYLATIPFIGMIEAGYFESWPHRIEIRSPPENPELYCISAETCSTIMDDLIPKWQRLFVFLKDLATTPAVYSFPSLADKKDEVLMRLWDAHINSIGVGIANFNKALLPFFSQTERNFGEGWATTVEYIAVTYFVTDLNNTNRYQHMYMPPRILWNTDTPPKIADLSDSQNTALQGINIFSSFNSFLGRYMLCLWRRAMCSPQGREDGRVLMERFVVEPGIIFSQGISIVWNLITKNCQTSFWDFIFC